MKQIIKPKIMPICTANSGRSTLSQLVMEDELHDLGLSDEFDVVSSGTMVDALGKGGFPIVAMKKYIDMAVGSGVFSDAEQEQYVLALERRNAPKIEEIYNVATRAFLNEEHAARDEAMKLFRIPGQIKPKGEQTVARDDVVIALAMDHRNRDNTIKIYRDAGYEGRGSDDIVTTLTRGGHMLKVATLAAYARNDPKAETPNAFGLGRGVYMNMVPTILEDSRQAVRKFTGR